jgi:phosphoglycerate dehydrogenase-like enzyme
MRDGAPLVNTARGCLVGSDALLSELKSGRLNAVLEATDPEERVPPDSPFLGRENCLVTPHIAAPTDGTWSAMAEETVDQITTFLAGQNPPNEVRLEEWDRIARQSLFRCMTVVGVQVLAISTGRRTSWQVITTGLVRAREISGCG